MYIPSKYLRASNESAMLTAFFRLFLNKTSERVLIEGSESTGSGDVCLCDDDRSWATGTSIGSPWMFVRAVSRSTSQSPKSQQKVVIGEVWADFLPAVADFLPGRVSGAPNLGPSFSPSPGKSRLVPQPPPQGSRSPSDARRARLFPCLF